MGGFFSAPLGNFGGCCVSFYSDSLGLLLIVSITIFSALSTPLVILPSPGCNTYLIAGFFKA
jgi:hypothetical protein